MGGLEEQAEVAGAATGRPIGSRYLLGETIGRGASGRVYRGQVSGGGEVAVKVLREEVAEEPELVSAFLQERQVLRSISHPNVVQVIDLVAESDDLAIVMQLVHGGDLRSAVPGPVPADEALRLLAQVADGLVAVHAAGVVHCDLKPANVLCQQEADGRQRLRLTDFGISLLTAEAPVTGHSGIIGTPGYMAPEVGFGAAPTPAADVYALGVMLYELCTGSQPFTGPSPLSVMLAHAHAELRRPIGMPDSLWRLLGDLLAKDPARRPTADQAAARMLTLAPSLDGEGPFAMPAGGPAVSTDRSVPRKHVAEPDRADGAGPVWPARPVRGPGPSGADPAPAPMPIVAAAPVEEAPPVEAAPEEVPPPQAPVRAVPLGPSPRFRPDGPVIGTGIAALVDETAAPRRTDRGLALIALAAASLLTVSLVGALALADRDDAVTVIADASPAPTPSAAGATISPEPITTPSQAPSGSASSGTRANGIGVVQAQVPPGRPAVSVAGAGVGKAVVRVSRVSAPGATIASVSVTHLGRRVTVSSSGNYSATFDKLTAGQRYEFTARVCTTDGLCATSGTASYTPPKLPPGKPALSAAESGEGQALLKVTNVKAVTGKIASITVAYGGATVAVPVGAGTASSYQATVSNLTAGQPYAFTAKVCNSLGLCTSSAAASYTPPERPPGVPSLAVAEAGKGQVKLTVGDVTANTGTIGWVGITYGTQKAGIGVGDGRQSSYQTTINGLTAGTTYTFNATVCNTVELCATSTPVSYTVPVDPPKVGTVKLTRLLQLVTVTWSATTQAPTGTACTVVVNSTPTGSGLASRKITLAAGKASFTGKAKTSYQAVKTCTYPQGEVSATSNVLAIP